MKTYQYRYQGEAQFTQEISALKETLSAAGHGAVLFHIFAECWCDQEAASIRRIIREAIPEARLTGTASFGNIYEGGYTREDLVITAMVFERPTSRIETFCIPLDPAQASDALDDFITQVKARPWVKAVEALIMADFEMVTHCCDALSALPEEIAFFGGKSRFDHAPEAPKFVIDDDGICRFGAAAFVLYGGEDLHIQTGLIQGWNPLGKAMKVTRAKGDILCELDGKPAHELYYKYLHIKNDAGFFFNTLEFPFLFYKDGASVIRISHACLEDGSMVLGASIPEHDYVRIAFGDSREILRSVLRGGKLFEAFRPDTILLYSCGCRRTFWGDEASNKETLPFVSLAPTSGFYTAGELLRQNGVITEHNSTLVVAALREGDAEEKPPVRFGMDDSDLSEDESLISRLSTFISAAIDELEQANRELEQANRNLERLSITDGLTGLLNRAEAERRIRAALKADASSEIQSAQAGNELIMIDMDDFKDINDTFGHQEGDQVLRCFSALLREITAPLGDRVQTGRWGGEEFILLVTDAEQSMAAELAEEIRRRFADTSFPSSGSHSISVGVTRVLPSDSVDSALSRADQAMYEAKRQGKNRVAIL